MVRFGFPVFLFLAFMGNTWADEEQAGRRLYLEGVTPSGEPLGALVGFGQTPLSGQAVACGNCHGANGKGRPEGAVLPPDITWEELGKPYGHAHPTGRKHEPFSETSLARAVNEGVDPAGNRLDWAMPRYALSRAEAEALLGYLKQLGAEREPGIGERSLRIGAILPEHGRTAEAARAMRAALAAYAESVNRAGGVHQRRLELVVAGDYGDAQKRFAAQPVFALLSPTEAGQEGELGAFVARAKLPALGPFAAAGEALAESSGLLFHVLPGLAEQAAVLVEFAARRSGASPLRVAIAASGAAADEHAAQAVLRRCAARCGEVARIGWYAARFDAAAAVKRFKAEGREQLFFFGSDEEFARLLEEAGRARDESWQPALYAPGALARSAAAAGGRFGGEIFLAFSVSPTQRTGSGPQAWDALRGEFGLSRQYEAAQRSALASASVLTEGLRRAGRDLSREGLVRALETLNNYDPQGYGPAVSFGPDRRVGALGGYVAALERGRGFVPASGWIALD
jgi:ABC-type branched-subunit amino acid transport system substrate-binding protein